MPAPWERYAAPQQTPDGLPRGAVLIAPPDPVVAARENRAERGDLRAEASAARQAQTDAARLDLDRARLAQSVAQQARPSLPAGYMLGPDGATAVRIPGLPADKNGPAPKSEEEMASVRAEALDKVKLARSLQGRSRDGWFNTGLGANVASWFSGSPAFDVRQDTETLKNAGALTRIMEVAKANGGKNPLTPLSNSDFQALASSLSNLEPSQSDEQYHRNVQRVIDLYSRAYEGAGGKDLEGDLSPASRDRPAAAIGAPPPMPGGPSGSPPGGGGGPATLATGAFKTVSDPALAGVNGRVNSMLMSGASDTAIRAYLAKSGAGASPDSVEAALAYRRRHPGYKGAYKVDLESRDVPTTAWNRFAASPLGTGAYAAIDGALAGTTDELGAAFSGNDLAELNARKQIAFDTNPVASTVGGITGNIASMAGLGMAAKGVGLGARFANPQLAADLTFGAMSGAGQSNDGRLIGAAVGAAGAGVGNMAGQAIAVPIGAAARTRPGIAAVNRMRGMFGATPGVNRLTGPLPPISGPSAPTAAERIALDTIEGAKVPDVIGNLADAQAQNLPFTLADAAPSLGELAGASARRSPVARDLAEGMLLSRNRGQIDRLGQAVERNLGPIGNIPRISQEMTDQARTAAGPLYDAAYARPVYTTPEIEATLGTPFGRSALGRARTIAANERRSPTELGFALDDAGNTVLNPQPTNLMAGHLGARAELDAAQEAYKASRGTAGVDTAGARGRVEAARAGLRKAEEALRVAPDPSMPVSAPGYTTQTLDYVKRGMDDVLEEQRNPITGKLVLDEAGRAQNGVRQQFLREVDNINPAYAAARSAYAGPVQARDAMALGQDAFRLNPDELGVQVGRQSPEHLAQMQLGYRSALMDRGNGVPINSNPWNATLGTPAAEARLGTMFPGNPGVGNMLKQRDLEGQMARTATRVVEGSQTAGRQIADQSFLTNPMITAAADVGTAAATGGIPVATAMRTLAGSKIGDTLKLGLGKKAEKRAEALMPMLLDPNPAANLALIDGLINNKAAYDAFVKRMRPSRSGGMFGAAIGADVGNYPFR